MMSSCCDNDSADSAADRKTDVPIALFSADDVANLGDLETVDRFISKSEPIPKVLEIVDHLLNARFLFRT